MFLSKCAAYISKKLRSIKVQEASGLLTNLGLKTPLSITPLLGDKSILINDCHDDLIIVIPILLCQHVFNQ